MGDVLESYPLLLRGAWNTIQLTLYSAVFSLVLAMFFGTAGAVGGRPLRAATRVYVEFFRGTATLVLMYWLFFALPLAGFRLQPMVAGVLALSLNVGAYGAEVVRGSIRAVPQGQYEAAVAVNMSRYQALRRVILPQAVALMLPPFGNLLIELLKATAVVSLISISDLTFRAQQLRAATGHTAAAFVVVLVMYFAIAQLLQVFVRYLERRTDRMLGRRPRRAKGRAVAGATPAGTGASG